MLSSDIRPLLQEGETQLQFDERVNLPIHMYPSDCSCGNTIFGVVCHDHPRAGESWCLRCGEDG